ncbi:ImpA family metalloprotease [Algicola sagamiensis]|uniref:ImpA family metalloprotease n=1 Tax=Algicola sagamiensis TaxID=163869 RepID=UPI000376299D|nr:ImpA family metalloprotease [Algicola sagamiensis]
MNRYFSKTKLFPLFVIVALSACFGDDKKESTDTSAKEVAVNIDAQLSIGGQIKPEKLQVTKGSTATMTVTPEPGFALNSVTGCNGTLVENQFFISNADQDCTINAEFLTKAEIATRKENHQLASEKELISYSLKTLEQSESQRKDIVQQLWKEIASPLSWHPGKFSVTLTSYKPGRTFQILRSTQDESGTPSSEGLIYVGKQNEHRYAAMAGNMFAVDPSEETSKLLKNMIQWLTGKLPSERLQIVTSHIYSRSDSHYAPYNEKIREWFKTSYAVDHVVNEANTCDQEQLKACIENVKPDLIILSNKDRSNQGYERLRSGVEMAISQQIPLIMSNYEHGETSISRPIYRYMGLVGKNNYEKRHHTSGLAQNDLTALQEFGAVQQLLKNLEQQKFDMDALHECDKNYIHCEDKEFQSAFREGAQWYRTTAQTYDESGLSVFHSENDNPVFAAGLLLADKYRSEIDYPIQQGASADWQKAMFADWAVSYARRKNIAQPDLGTFVLDKSDVVKGKNAHYKYPDTTEETKQFTIPYSGQWTTTGWYALPGKEIEIERLDSSPAILKIQLNYHRSNTNRAYQKKIYRFPLELMQRRLVLNQGETINFSTPYGGPIYVYMSGDMDSLSVRLSAKGVAKHPTITDFTDAEQITKFEKLVLDSEIPHVDLRTNGAEQHLRKDKFMKGISGDIPDVKTLLKFIEKDHLKTVYTLAGFKVQGKNLEESLPADVKEICKSAFGENDCFDADLHTRKIIQHANYDQNAHCGSGCSGNPWDASWAIDPTGWGDNHELGHNLQVKRLNVHYVEAKDRDKWTKYSKRSGENSNNIFPYFVKWKSHFIRDKQTTIISDGHMDHKDLFFAFMSDAGQVKDKTGKRVVLTPDCKIMDDGGNRFTAPWKSKKYAVHNSFRMAFYIQMALRAHEERLLNGKRLDNGFHLFTLLYQHQRIFGKYARSKNDWELARDGIGFSEFPFDGHAVYDGSKVKQIPGNDFMLVSLSYLTEMDWRPYFDMFGLRYSSLAANQVLKNAKKGMVKVGMYVLEDDLPPANMTRGLEFLEMNISNSSTVWPRAKSGAEKTPLDCSI